MQKDVDRDIEKIVPKEKKVNENKTVKNSVSIDRKKMLKNKQDPSYPINPTQPHLSVLSITFLLILFILSFLLINRQETNLVDVEYLDVEYLDNEINANEYQ